MMTYHDRKLFIEPIAEGLERFAYLLRQGAVSDERAAFFIRGLAAALECQEWPERPA